VDLRLVFLDFLINLRVFPLEMHVETSFASVRLLALLHRTSVLSLYLDGSPPLSLLFAFVGDVEMDA